MCDDGDDNGLACDPAYDDFCEYCTVECTTEEVFGGVCGDGTLDVGYEECDDGNTDDGDGCDSSCMTETICVDEDGDGYSITGGECGPVDCNDDNPDSYQVGDYYFDSDGDGYHNYGPPNYNSDDTVSICYGDEIPSNYMDTTLGRDCDDTDPAVTNECWV